ncbi:MAG: hypothetical protein MUE56_09725, partial [Ignavibacteria bacterium]|nr:hypothetical protein [Ignavibacteria bacterium]
MAEIDHQLISSLPDLLSQYHQGETPTQIKILQGRDLFLKLYNRILEEENKEIQYFGSAEDFIRFISDEEEEKWKKRRIKKDIWIKVLLLPSETSEKL